MIHHNILKKLFCKMDTSSSNDVNDDSEPLIEIIPFDQCDECYGD